LKSRVPFDAVTYCNKLASAYFLIVAAVVPACLASALVVSVKSVIGCTPYSGIGITRAIVQMESFDKKAGFS
jgi:hypothetical protein